jgi:hypothetical protein
MTTVTQAYAVRPIEPSVVAELRVRDDAGRAPTAVIDADGGNPLRCCLQLSRPGERLVLASYAPLRRWAAATGADPGAYDEVGPVFLHAEPCDGAVGDTYPEQMREWPRVFRAYDRRGHIVGGQVKESGQAPEPLLAELFVDPDVVFVHARAVVNGCFTFAVERRPGGAA